MVFVDNLSYMMNRSVPFDVFWGTVAKLMYISIFKKAEIYVLKDNFAHN